MRSLSQWRSSTVQIEEIKRMHYCAPRSAAGKSEAALEATPPCLRDTGRLSDARGSKGFNHCEHRCKSRRNVSDFFRDHSGSPKAGPVHSRFPTCPLLLSMPPSSARKPRRPQKASSAAFADQRPGNFHSTRSRLRTAKMTVLSHISTFP